MLRFIVWMIIVFVAAKILGQAVRYMRLLMTPNKDVQKRNSASHTDRKKHIEDIPYEEIKDKE